MSEWKRSSYVDGIWSHDGRSQRNVRFLYSEKDSGRDPSKTLQFQDLETSSRFCNWNRKWSKENSKNIVFKNKRQENIINCVIYYNLN